MEEFIKKLIAELEYLQKLNYEAYETAQWNNDKIMYINASNAYANAISIANQLAEEYKYKYVSIETLKQVMWERDVAISQLKELGYEFGEKVGWIPCSEMLPEVFDNVFICTKNGGRAIGHRCPNQADGRFYDLHSSAIDEVIAWQPLPEPYKPTAEQLDSISEAWKQRTMSRFERVE